MTRGARKPSTPAPELRCVALVRPGVPACGHYVSGEEYWLPPDEAARLVNHKGFIYVDDAPPTATNADQEH